MSKVIRVVGGIINEGFQNIYIYIYEFHHIGSYGKLLIQRKKMMKIQG
jgi:hypothetical protein